MKSTPFRRITAMTLFAAAITLFVALTIPDRLVAKPPRPGASAVSGGHTEGRSPNRFLNELAYEHAYPEAPSHPYVRTIAPAKAYKAFQDVRSGDMGHGRAGTWRTVGPSTVLNPVDPAIPGAPLWKNLSGRVTALAIGRTCTASRCRLWAGTAGEQHGRQPRARPE
jgi:hypothetical protein